MAKMLLWLLSFYFKIKKNIFDWLRSVA
jgi:hypothetical protein